MRKYVSIQMRKTLFANVKQLTDASAIKPTFHSCVRQITMTITKVLTRSVTSLRLWIRTRARLVILLMAFVSSIGVIVLVQLISKRTVEVHKRIGPKKSYANLAVRDCVMRTPTTAGRTFEVKVRGVNVSFAGWTADESFDKEVVALRTHEAVRIMSRLERAGTLLDIGANIGKVTFPTLALPQTHTVVAVEPVGVNVNQLCMTGNLNGWLGHSGFVLLQAAMSDRNGSKEIFVPEGREDNAALNAEAATANVGNTEHGEHVRVIVGDDVLEEGGLKPDFIKIDTQGHELHVLRGLRRYLATSGMGRVLVMAESDPKLMRMSRVDPTDIYRLMVEELGYNAYCRPIVDAKDGRFVVTGKALKRDEYPPGGCRDIFYFKQRWG